MATLTAEDDLFRKSGFWPDWLVNAHRIALYDVPSTFEGVSRVYHWPNEKDRDTEGLNARFVLPSCGGVEIDYQSLPARVQRRAHALVEPIRFAILDQRPNEAAPAWPVTVGGAERP